MENDTPTLEHIEKLKDAMNLLHQNGFLTNFEAKNVDKRIQKLLHSKFTPKAEYKALYTPIEPLTDESLWYEAIEGNHVSSRLYYRIKGMFNHMPTIAELKDVSMYEFKRLAGVGIATIKELEGFCAKYGIRLKP